MIILSDFGRKNSCIVRVGLYHVMILFLGEGDCLSCRVPDHLAVRPYFGGYRNKMTGAMWGCLVEIGAIITHIDILINIPYTSKQLMLGMSGPAKAYQQNTCHSPCFEYSFWMSRDRSHGVYFCWRCNEIVQERAT